MNRERIYQVIIGALVFSLVGVLTIFVYFNYDISITKRGNENRNNGDNIIVTKEKSSINPNSDHATVPRMTASELNDKLGDSDVLVLDVRDVSHWNEATEKIKGAVREDPTDFESWYKKYSKDKEKTIVTYCD